MPHIPAELLYPIFSYLRDEPNQLPFPHLGLLSCSLVCRFWYLCAFPFLLKDNNIHFKHNPDRYTTIDLERFAALMTESQRYGLDHWTLIEWVKIDVSKLSMGIFNRLDRRRINAIGRLIRALQHRRGMAVELTVRAGTRWRWEHRSNCTVRPKIMRHFVSKFKSNLVNITTLHLRLLDRPHGADPPISHCHPIILLIRHLHTQLENILLDGCDITLAVIEALRSCQKIHTARILYSRFYIGSDDLATTVGTWPRLRHLAIFCPSPPFVGIDATVSQLARSPPPNLEHLDLDNLACITLSSTALYSHHLPALLQHCAHSLVYLDLPANHFDRNVGAHLLTSLARLHFPRLETLSLTRIKSIANVPAFYNIPIQWPNLRRFLIKAWHIDISRIVAKIVLECPKLELVRMVTRSSPNSVLREAGFVRMENSGKWAGEGEPWVRKVQESGGDMDL